MRMCEVCDGVIRARVQGKYTYANNTVYIGYYKDDEITGQKSFGSRLVPCTLCMAAAAAIAALTHLQYTSS